MKANFNFSLEKIKEMLGRYKLVLLIILAGVVLLLIPAENEEENSESSIGISGVEEDFSVEELEKKIGAILSKIDGAGDVTVVLTVRTGMERILATEKETLLENDYQRSQESPIIISGENGEEVVLTGQNYPIFQGALAVCEGGDDPEIKLKITQSLAALTGLSSGRITVCKGR